MTREQEKDAMDSVRSLSDTVADLLRKQGLTSEVIERTLHPLLSNDAMAKQIASLNAADDILQQVGASVAAELSALRPLEIPNDTVGDGLGSRMPLRRNADWMAELVGLTASSLKNISRLTEVSQVNLEQTRLMATSVQALLETTAAGRAATERTQGNLLLLTRVLVVLTAVIAFLTFALIVRG